MMLVATPTNSSFFATVRFAVRLTPAHQVTRCIGSGENGAFRCLTVTALGRNLLALRRRISMALSKSPSASVRAFCNPSHRPGLLAELVYFAAVMLISICVCQLLFRLISPQRQVLLLLRLELLALGPLLQLVLPLRELLLQVPPRRGLLLLQALLLLFLAAA